MSGGDERRDAVGVGDVGGPVAKRAHHRLSGDFGHVSGVLRQPFARSLLERILTKVFTSDPHDREAVGQLSCCLQRRSAGRRKRPARSPVAPKSTSVSITAIVIPRTREPGAR